jgi:hypothetical protein
MNFEQSYKALRHWVTESTKSNKLDGNALTIEQRIQNLLNASPPLRDEILVYRGHSPVSPTIYSDRGWFSTSSDLDKVLRQHISDDTSCCLFKIHLVPGIKYINVDATIERAGLEKTGYDESEIIVNGGGTFYANPELTKVGFKQIDPAERVTNITTGRVSGSMGYTGLFGRLVKHKYKTENITQYETWYSTQPPPPPPNKRSTLTTENILKKINGISDDMLDMIDNVDDLIAFEYLTTNNINEDNKNIIQTHINSKKSKSGGRRKTRKLYRKSRKSRKARTKLLYH